jgi:hypothetical protein
MGMASPSAADIITVPSGLTPGSQYRLVFVTVDSYQATSTSIADYNTDVTNEANTAAALAALATTWTVIGSTESVDAITDIGSDPGVPIYDLLDSLIGNDATANAGGLFSGSIFSPIDVNELGLAYAGEAWTGSTSSGLGDPTYYFGAPQVRLGNAGSTDSGWITLGVAPAPSGFALYSISGVLTVPAAVPEPRTTLMMALGGALLIGARRRMIHRKNRATQTLC